MIVYHNDHLGTPQKLTAVNGAVVWSAVYSSFGKATVDEASTVVNNLRFPGQYLDEESGLHWNFWRYYDPEIGRYTRTDPIGLENENSNLYQYVFNNPIHSFDPTGEATTIAIPITFIILVGVTIIVVSDFLNKPIVEVPWHDWPDDIAISPPYCENRQKKKKRTKKEKENLKPRPTIKTKKEQKGEYEPDPGEQVRLCIAACRSAFKGKFFKRQLCIAGCLTAFW